MITGPKATIIGVRRWVKYGNTETGLPDELNDLGWAKGGYSRSELSHTRADFRSIYSSG
jgi:hypothetical protein